MAVAFTADQLRAIEERDCNILVSAAAGSGKTAVLVERIARLVGDEDGGVDIDRLLVVTFTKAAAAQMKERLFDVLSKRAESEPQNSHLQRQLTLVYNAQITTIDSFCLYLIRNHFNDIGLDPDFRTADEGEGRLLCQDVLQELLEEQFAKKDPGFLECVECFVPGGSEKRLEELVLQLYTFAMSDPFPEEWLKRHRSDYAVSSLDELYTADWYRAFKETVWGVLAQCRMQTEQTLALCRQPDGPYMYEVALMSDLELVGELEKGFPDLHEALCGISFARLGSKSDVSVSPEKKERAKAGRERVKKWIKGLAEKYFYAPQSRWLADMQKVSAPLGVLADLALLFKEKLDAKKREKNLLDFADMEHMALQILTRKRPDGGIEPTATALEYREQYREILIDEYQDSNLVQELLLKSISGEEDGRHNRFMVGDVKQSVYRFRLARPELFMEKMESYQKDGGPCLRVDLRQNFRSRTQVTACVNDIFTRIMHRGLGKVEYDRDAMLCPAAHFPKANAQGCYEPEFLAVAATEGQDARQLEACMVADKIRSLVGSLPVRDKNTGELRKASYRDIVILLRTVSGWDETFKKVLEQYGIPVHVTSKTGYFAASEVQTVLHFLRILDNPLQDIPFFGVLHSCIGQFSDEEIAAFRAADGTGKRRLYDCVALAAGGQDEKARQFLEFLNRFREYAVYLPIHKLLERLFEETDYLCRVGAMPGGSQRRANVDMLLVRAEAFEQTSYSGLFHFVRYMEQMEKYDVDFGESGTMDENADVVRIMSIHKSKGLEFPVCFVSGLSKRFNRQDAMQPVIMDTDLGLAMDCIDPVSRTRRPTLKKNVLARKLWEDSMGEELRVLYVAMTRAEEKLVLTASCREEFWQAAQGEGVESDPLFASPLRLLEAGSFFDILLYAWLEAKRPVTWVGMQDFVGGELAATAKGHNARQRLEQEALNACSAEELEELQGRLSQGYAHENLKELFVKTTVSELKKAGMQEEAENGAQLFAEEEVIPYVPKFIRQTKEQVTGTLRGSAYHRLLELFPFGKTERDGIWTKEQIVGVVEKAREEGKLSEEFAQVINPEKIRIFLQSSLAGRMCRAGRLGRLFREQPFVLGIGANQLQKELPESETVLIQGIIDVFFEEGDGLVVADYKTDAVKEPKELIQRYRVQLDYYAQALERLTQKPVKEKIIYSFALGREIPL